MLYLERLHCWGRVKSKLVSCAVTKDKRMMIAHKVFILSLLRIII
jgi:hypothetical protein